MAHVGNGDDVCDNDDDDHANHDGTTGYTCMHIYIYIYTHTPVIYIYIYIYTYDAYVCIGV